MPVTKKRLPGGKVRVETPGGIKSKGSSPEKAAAQERLLNALEHNPGWKPTGKKLGKPTKPPAPKAMPPMPKGPMMKPGEMQMPMGMPPMMSMKPKGRKGTGKMGKK